MSIGHQIEFVEFFNRTVTLLAFHPRLDVPVVAKLNMFGQPMNLNPFDGSPLLRSAGSAFRDNSVLRSGGLTFGFGVRRRGV